MTDQSTGELLEGNSVAVIGMAGRFPGAPTLEDYWQNLVNGVEGIERSGNGSDPSKGPGDLEVGAASRLKDIDRFDADFFGFSPKEAELMDPQHRLFLECVHEGLERAGYDADRYAGLVGLYGGMGANTYFRHVLEAIDRKDGALGLQLVIGNDKDYLTTMVSYKLNLRGPSIDVQTACSTSLVAVHLACQGLLDFECDVAVAGGVSVRAPQPSSYRYYEGGILSPDGYCRPFDARAQGTVFGNGLGVVVLRRLEDALADGDCIAAVIRGSAVNNDGAAKVGYTAPAVRGQVEMIAAALARSGVDPATIQYIEAHGTGTPLGDPIEVKALTEAYRRKTAAVGYCGLGSVKSSIGHLDAAAGVAGLIKTVLALQHRTMPPTLHFREANPQLSLDQSPFYVVSEAKPWDGPRPLRAAVSSLGIGGTNAHVVLEEAPAVPQERSARSQQLLVLSAKSEGALDTATAQLAAHLRTHPEIDLAPVAYTLQAGRREFRHRRVAVCSDVQDAVAALDVSGARLSTRLHEGATPSVAFMFPGGGAHHVNMAAGLYRTEPAFRRQFDACLAPLHPSLGAAVTDAVFPPEGREADATRRLQQTSVALPALFVVEYALARLWMEWGVRPQALIGHSLGEYVAACLAGVFTLSDALSLVVRRGQLMERLASGAMLSVPLSEDDVRPFLTPDLSLAAVNAPSLCVVSGPLAAIDALKASLAARGLEARTLHIAVGAHSHLVEPILDSFHDAVSALRLRPPGIPMLSNVSGTWITNAEATSPEYWTTHIRATVRFADGVGTLLEDPSMTFVEVGPGRTLSTLAREHPRGGERLILSSLPHPYDPDPDVRVMFGALGALWMAGVNVDWKAHHGTSRPSRVPLPTYPFERHRYWIGGESMAARAPRERTRTPVDEWFHVPGWKQSAPAAALPRRQTPDGGATWLIFADATSLGELVSARLEARGDRVLTVTAGESFSRSGHAAFTIDPSRPGDYDALFRALGRERPLHGILHLWNVTRDTARRTPASRRADRTSTFERMLFLAQAAHANGFGSFHLAVCASGLAQVLPGDPVVPGTALLAGACRVLPQEYAGVTTRWIDLSLPKKWAKVDRLADLVVQELDCQSPVQAVAYRGGQRWVQCFDQVALRADAPSRLKAGGAYLVTGGVGGLGLILARYLATTFQAKLVLAGRTALPPRDTWQELTARGAGTDYTTGAIATIAELEAAGSQVFTVAADVTDPHDVERMFREATSHVGRLDGVFHLAGVPGGGVMQLKTAAIAAGVCAPKVQGSRHVIEACRGRRLDFVALFSSIAGVTGGIGQSDYCAASAYMDALPGAYSHKDDPRVVVIDWDAWQADRWQDAALLHLPEIREQSKRWRSQFGIRPEEGMSALSRVLSTNLPRVVISTQDLREAMDAHDRALAAARQRAEPAARGDVTRPRTVAYVAPATATETLVASTWESVLGRKGVGIHDNFFGLGGHSLLMLQVVARLRQELAADVPVRALFERPTVAELSKFIDDRRAASADPAPVDDEALASVLAEVERMSPDQVRTELSDLAVSDSGSRA